MENELYKTGGNCNTDFLMEYKENTLNILNMINKQISDQSQCFFKNEMNYKNKINIHLCI